MNEWKEWIDAYCPDPYIILGLRLRPLSIGHILLLSKIGSPYVIDDGSIPHIGDLTFALLICSMTYEEGIELLDSDVIKIIQQWKKKIAKESGLMWWLGIRKSKEIDFKSANEMFSDYLACSTKQPSTLISGDGDTEVKAPPLQTIIISLLKNTNLSEKDILDRPYSRCVWDVITIGAFEGTQKIQSESEEKLMNENLKKLEEILQNGNIKITS